MKLESQNLISKNVAEFYNNEKLDGGKLFGRLAFVIKGPEVQTSAICLYRYLRILDDGADGLKPPSEMKQILREEMSFLTEYLKNDDAGEVTHSLSVNSSEEKFEINEKDRHERRLLLLKGLGSVAGKSRKSLAEAVLGSLESIYLDNLTRLYGRAQTDEVRKMRDENALYMNFNLLSIIFFNRPFAKEENKKSLQKFMEWASRCDALNDLNEDLEQGLIMYGKNILKSFGIVFTPNQVIPEEVEKLFESEKSKLLKEKEIMAPAIFKSELPFIFKQFFYFYVLYKIHQLTNKQYSSKGVIFAKSPNDIKLGS